MPLKRPFLGLGAKGNGARGVIVVCDAWGRRNPSAVVAEKAFKWGTVAVKRRLRTRGLLLWICTSCYAGWSVHLRATEFSAQKRRKRGGGR
jgi:hypothetical protein